MSHIVQVQTQVRDPVSLVSACVRLKLAVPQMSTVCLYDGEYSGLCISLPNWRYPVVCDTTTGSLKYDNFQGHWGEQKELDRFLQAYAVEKAKLEARRNGHEVSELTLTDGSVRLTVQVAGGAV